MPLLLVFEYETNQIFLLSRNPLRLVQKLNFGDKTQGIIVGEIIFCLANR